ncbi:MAG: SAM hydrolase/SAM-dependent halogenase family protein [Dehalococcoidales bacterium]
MKYLLLAALLISLMVTLPACAAPTKTNLPIVLLTDFGTDDYRVPRLKGVIYSANPDAEVIDATHGIAAQDIAAGAYVLGLTADSFPEKTVFVGAVGAGSTPDEKSIVVINNKDQIFVLPDNGLMTFVALNMGVKSVYEITNQELFDSPMAGLASHQILGKTAAMIASGYTPEKVGPVLTAPVMLDIRQALIADGKLTGYVVFVDHFGNCLTNINGEDTKQFGIAVGDSILITVAGNTVTAVVGQGYSAVPKGNSVVLVNSLGTLQLSINRGNFATTYSVKTGFKVEIEKSTP